MADDFGIADGLRRLIGESGGLGEEATDFANEPGGDHLFDASIDAVGLVFARAAEADSAVGVSRWAGPLLLLLADGAAGAFENFERAFDAAEIVGVNAGGGVGVDASEFGVERFRALAGGSFAEAGSKFGVGGGAIEEAVEQGHEVERSSGDGEDRASAGGDVGDGGVGSGHEAGDAEGFGWLGDVDEVVRDALPLGGRWLGGADVHSPIDLHGVDAEDLGIEAFGEGQGEGGLADGGAAEEQVQLAGDRRLGHNRPRRRGGAGRRAGVQQGSDRTMRRVAFSVTVVIGIVSLASCVNVKAPERIDIGSGSGGYHSGSSKAPNPGNLDDCKAELNRAYSKIDSLEKRCDSLEADKKKYKEERDEWKDKYKALKDRYND